MLHCRRDLPCRGGHRVFHGRGATYIRSNTGQTDQNFGGTNPLILGTSQNSSVYRVLLNFDLSTIPAGATIDSVTLSMTGTTGESASFDAPAGLRILQLTTGFSEGDGVSSNGIGPANGHASWDNAGPSQPWADPGGDFSTIPLATITKNPRNLLAAWNFTSTAAFPTAVESSIGDIFSLMLRLDSEELSQRRIFFLNSDEAASNRPTLSVTYSIPEPTVICLGGVAVLPLLIRRGKAVV